MLTESWLGQRMQFGQLKRREFITLLGGAMTWPLAARAQQPGKLPTIGFLGASTPSAWSRWSAAFVRRLGELGWTDGRTVAIEYRWADGRNERFSEIAAEFVRLKVDVILTVGGAAIAAKRATSTIPIVFAVAIDPVGTGLVASLGRPGGNVTGLSMQAIDLAGKRLELLREVLPVLQRLAILANVGYPASVVEIGEVQGAARKLSYEVEILEIRRAEDIGPAFERLKSGVHALYVCGDALSTANSARINTLAMGARLPTIFPDRSFLEAGVSDAADAEAIARRFNARGCACASEDGGAAGKPAAASWPRAVGAPAHDGTMLLAAVTTMLDHRVALCSSAHGRKSMD
jgi:putative ABC transport system substrate-binding protein